jgi:hypothetical protein
MRYRRSESPLARHAVKKPSVATRRVKNPETSSAG